MPASARSIEPYTHIRSLACLFRKKREEKGKHEERKKEKKRYSYQTYLSASYIASKMRLPMFVATGLAALTSMMPVPGSAEPIPRAADGTENVDAGSQPITSPSPTPFSLTSPAPTPSSWVSSYRTYTFVPHSTPSELDGLTCMSTWLSLRYYTATKTITGLTVPTAVGARPTMAWTG